MTNSNYVRGRAREYQVMNLLRSKGWVCSRSAMSHGPVDVFAAKSGRILLIQVKSGSARVKPDEILMLKSYAVAFNADAQVWSFKKRGVLLKTVVFKRNKPKPAVLTRTAMTRAIETEKKILDEVAVPLVANQGVAIEATSIPKSSVS
jgi:Holliday junction resolvase